MSIRMIYDLIKWYKKKQKGETREEQPPMNPEAAYKYLDKYTSKLIRRFKVGLSTSPYLHLIDPDMHPEEEQFIRKAVKETQGGSPLAMRLAVKLDIPKETEFAHCFGPALELIMFLNGIENEDEALKRPDLIKEAFKLARALAQGKPYIYKGIVIPPDPREVPKIAPIAIHDIEDLSIEDIETWEKWFEEFYKKHPELIEEAEKEEEDTAEALARELRPPNIMNSVLSKLELLCEQAEWMGGVDIRALKKILRDMREGAKTARHALTLIRGWGREGRTSPKDHEGSGAPGGDHNEYGVTGYVERLSRAVRDGRCSAATAAAALSVLYAEHAIIESPLEEYLSGITDHVVEEHGQLILDPSRLEEQVIKPLRNIMRAILPES